jgi:hypothetical protein
LGIELVTETDAIAPPHRLRQRNLVCAPFALALLLLPTREAPAVVMGSPSALGSHLVRIYAGHYCTGVAIARRAVVTARHCVRGGMRIVADGISIGIKASGLSAALDDGRRVSVSGDAAILTLSSPLPSSVQPVAVGEGQSANQGESYTIAGYGTATERHRAAFGTLREARLVAAEAHALVDPDRQGSIGASACFGDSGGPVLRGGALIGIVTRAAHPHPRIACGHLTRWVPIVASGEISEPADLAESDGEGFENAQPARRKVARTRVARLSRARAAINDFHPVPRE